MVPCLQDRLGQWWHQLCRSNQPAFSKELRGDYPAMGFWHGWKSKQNPAPALNTELNPGPWTGTDIRNTCDFIRGFSYPVSLDSISPCSIDLPFILKDITISITKRTSMKIGSRCECQPKNKNKRKQQKTKTLKHEQLELVFAYILAPGSSHKHRQIYSAWYKTTWLLERENLFFTVVVSFVAVRG